MKRLFFGLIITASFIFGGIALGSNRLAYADAKTVIQGGACDASGGTCPDGDTSVNGTIKTVVNLLSVAAGVIAVIMIIIAGLRYITSGGASDKITSAKNALVYAIIGLVIVALAQIIVRFVLKNATSNSSGGTSTTSTPQTTTQPSPGSVRPGGGGRPN